MENKAQQHNEPWSSRHRILADLIGARDGMHTGAEIGVAFGGNAEMLLSRTSVKRLYGVDPYKSRMSYNDVMNKKQRELDKIYEQTIERLSSFGGRYVHVRKPSHKAADEITEPLDFVYIDGDHSYIGCLTDLRMWYEKVRDSGIVAGDDYGGLHFPGVTKAVDRFFGKLGIQVHTQSSGGSKVWWVVKRPASPSFRNRLFLQSSFVRVVHFYFGEIYNMTLGKLFYHGRMLFYTHAIPSLKKILPETVVRVLKRAYSMGKK